MTNQNWSHFRFLNALRLVNQSSFFLILIRLRRSSTDLLFVIKSESKERDKASILDLSELLISISFFFLRDDLEKEYV